MYTNIVVGTDGSATASKAVGKAAEIAALSQATLVVVSAYRPVPEERLRNERAGAPQDIAYMVNPEEDVGGILDGCEEAGRVERGEEGHDRVRRFWTVRSPDRRCGEDRGRADRRRQPGDDRCQEIPARKRA